METAKEKSKELHEKFLPLVDCGDNRYTTTIQEKNAKQCAIIAVDEIIDTLTELFNEHIHNEIIETLIESKIIYWQEVKNELNQL